MAIDASLLARLVCPRHLSPLSEVESRLHCEEGHDYPVVHDVPILLDRGPHTLWVAEASLDQVRHSGLSPERDLYYIDTLGISDEEKEALRKQLSEPGSCIDPVVSFMVGATNGIAYKQLIGNLKDYPIPMLRLPPANGEVLLDVGCNWGRWCIAAARLGYTTIGIDPSLGAVLAAKRVMRQMGLDANFVVGDARFLPFRTESLDVVYSYSVIQHFSKGNAIAAVKEIGRVLRSNGRSIVQMPTTLGLRCLYHQTHRRFREARGFEVRYWWVPTLRRLFTGYVGRTTFSVDCFFGIGLQAADVHFMARRHRFIIRTSEVLRKASKAFRGLCYVADSVYVESTKANTAISRTLILK